MALKLLFLAFASAVAGIYLTSPESKKARENLKKKKSAFEPIIKDLLNQINLILDDSKQIDSHEIKINITSLLKRVKKELLNIDLEQSLETIQEAIKVADMKVRKAYNESKTTKRTTSKK